MGKSRLETPGHCYRPLYRARFCSQQFESCSSASCQGSMSPSLNNHHGFHLWEKSRSILPSLQVSPIQQLDSKKSRELACLSFQRMLEQDGRLEVHPTPATHVRDEETKMPRGQGHPRSHSSGSEPASQTSVFPQSFKSKFGSRKIIQDFNSLPKTSSCNFPLPSWGE